MLFQEPVEADEKSDFDTHRCYSFRDPDTLRSGRKILGLPQKPSDNTTNAGHQG
jgi:hypothetical protein